MSPNEADFLTALEAFLDEFDALMSDDPKAALELTKNVPPELADDEAVMLARAEASAAVNGEHTALTEVEKILEESPDLLELRHYAACLAEELGDEPRAISHQLKLLELEIQLDELEGPVPPAVADEIQRVAEATLAELPDEFASRLEGVAVLLAERPDVEQVREGFDARSLGFFEGPTAAERVSLEAPAAVPRILLFVRSLVDAFGDEPDELTEQVRVTVLHEVGHYFGLEEDDLARLGLD